MGARGAATLVAAALLLPASGCGGGGGGGGQTDQQKIQGVVTTYYKAFARGDSNGACNQLTQETVQQLEKAASGKKCPDVLDQALKRPDYAKVATKLGGVKVTSVKVVGSAATATTQVPGIAGAGGAVVSTTVPLKKQGGTWKIASTIGEG